MLHFLCCVLATLLVTAAAAPGDSPVMTAEEIAAQMAEQMAAQLAEQMGSGMTPEMAAQMAEAMKAATAELPPGITPEMAAQMAAAMAAGDGGAGAGARPGPGPGGPGSRPWANPSSQIMIDPPQNFTVSTLSSSKIICRWEPPLGRYTNITGYNIRFRKVGDVSLSLFAVTGKTRQFTIENLESDTQYQVRVEATNAYGISPPTVWIETKTYALDSDDSGASSEGPAPENGSGSEPVSDSQEAPKGKVDDYMSTPSGVRLMKAWEGVAGQALGLSKNLDSFYSAGEKLLKNITRNYFVVVKTFVNSASPESVKTLAVGVVEASKTTLTDFSDFYDKYNPLNPQVDPARRRRRRAVTTLLSFFETTSELLLSVDEFLKEADKMGQKQMLEIVETLDQTIMMLKMWEPLEAKMFVVQAMNNIETMLS